MWYSVCMYKYIHMWRYFTVSLNAIWFFYNYFDLIFIRMTQLLEYYSIFLRYWLCSTCTYVGLYFNGAKVTTRFFFFFLKLSIKHWQIQTSTVLVKRRFGSGEIIENKWETFSGSVLSGPRSCLELVCSGTFKIGNLVLFPLSSSFTSMASAMKSAGVVGATWGS